jgi:hypothetical protein
MKIKISTRIVLLFKTFVIKIPVSYRGYLQCKNEKLIWDKYKHLGLLGELYWEKRGIICMKRYEPVKQVHHLDVFKIKNNIDEMNIINCDLYKIQNWGLGDTRQILIDYGISEEVSKMY